MSPPGGSCQWLGTYRPAGALFCKLVLSVGVHYTEDKSQLQGELPPAAVPVVVALIAAARFERLDRPLDRWEKELADLDAHGAGQIDLVPGLGFSLPPVVRGDKEMLVPMCGRLTFAASPIPRIQKAVNGEAPEKAQLLPRPRAIE